MADEDDDAPPPFSDQLERWLAGGERKTVGALVETFGAESFAVLFVILMAFPALPLPTGGVSHLLEIVTMLLALELVAGRREVWIPSRWRDKELKGITGPRFSAALLKRIRWFERFSRPRLAHAFDLRLTSMAYGLVVLVMAVGAFVAPPFSGLDTLPALGVVILSLGVLLGDMVVAGAGFAVGAGGIGIVIGLGRAAAELL